MGRIVRWVFRDSPYVVILLCKWNLFILHRHILTYFHNLDFAYLLPKLDGCDSSVRGWQNIFEFNFACDIRRNGIYFNWPLKHSHVKMCYFILYYLLLLLNPSYLHCFNIMELFFALVDWNIFQIMYFFFPSLIYLSEAFVFCIALKWICFLYAIYKFTDLQAHNIRCVILFLTMH